MVEITVTQTISRIDLGKRLQSEYCLGLFHFDETYSLQTDPIEPELALFLDLIGRTLVNAQSERASAVFDLGYGSFVGAASVEAHFNVNWQYIVTTSIQVPSHTAYATKGNFLVRETPVGVDEVAQAKPGHTPEHEPPKTGV